MLLILASRFDDAAASLARRWHEHDARLLTCGDLSRSGWTWDPAAPGQASLVLDGSSVPVGALRGAVSLLSGVGPGELPHILAEEREYVASEMSAFLLAWLSSLPCPLINPPTPLCLSGPHFPLERWLRLAARAGLRIPTAIRRAPRFACRDAAGSRPALYAGTQRVDDAPSIRVPVIRGRCLPAAPAIALPSGTEQGLERLAIDATAGLLTANLAAVGEEHFFTGAVPWVDVSRDDVANAILEALGIGA